MSEGASAEHARAGPRGHRAFQIHYNTEWPNQARSCGNRPPRVAFPELPPSPPLPMLVDPDAWLGLIDGRRYVRQVRSDGTVGVEHTRYYTGRRLAGQRVAVAVAAAERALVVYHRDTLAKQLPLRGLRGEILVFDRYIAVMDAKLAPKPAAATVGWPPEQRAPRVRPRCS